jgi:hypothetical protein
MSFLGIGYYKGEPNEHIIVYSSGIQTRAGRGITFFYWGPSTSIVAIPTGTIDVPFILNESTGNYQAVTIQGLLTYRIGDPTSIAPILNFSIDPASRLYKTQDPEKLAQRIVNEVQLLARAELAQMSLEQALQGSADMAGRILSRLKDVKALTSIGLEISSLHLVSMKPTPEMAKALEAEYREALQTKADQAMYQRRALAVEKERQIKENELATAVALEEKRKSLVTLQGENNKQQADFEAQALTRKLEPYKTLSPQTLLALSLKEMAQNAGKIGNLTITSEILESLLKARPPTSP